jgi:hypothetical protein
VVRADMGSGIEEVRGAEIVARGASYAARLSGQARAALVNGGPGWISMRDGALFAIASLTIRDGRITAMDILADPARLAGMDLDAVR